MPEHWLSELLRYCPHTLTMSKRRSRTGRWTLEHHVTPSTALAHIQTAACVMAMHAIERGMKFDDPSELLQWYSAPVTVQRIETIATSKATTSAASPSAVTDQARVSTRK